jgi:hypothetical protein
MASIRTQRTYYFNEEGSKKKRTDTAIRQLAETDFRYVEACSRYVMLDSIYKYLEAAVKVADRDMKVISREVTIQQTKLEHDAAGGFGNRGASPSQRTFRNWGGGNAEDNTPSKAKGRTIVNRGVGKR